MDVSEPENLGFCHQRLNRIEPKLKAYIDNGDIVGISTLVARRGQVVHRSLIGLMNTIANTPITTDAIFRVYSMTKPVICTALMMLHEEGRFHLDQPISQYLPQFTNQKVLRGGSFATPALSIRGSYRNFFRLDERWMLSGFRCVKDI